MRVERLIQIDALRGLAAFGVAIFFHAFYVQGTLYHGPGDSLPVLAWVYRWGWTLVDLFFVISGFVFAHVYLDERGRLKPGATVKTFAWARVARLYPLHLLTLLAAMALTIIAASTGLTDYAANDAARFVRHLLFIQVDGGFNVPAWSLAVEGICYALFILCAPNNRLRWCAPAFILLGLALTLHSGAPDRIGRGLIGFFVGQYVWRLRHVPVPRFALAAAAVLGFASPAWPLDYHVFLLLTAWPALILLAMRLPTVPAFVWLGDRSYSIYLVHYPLYMAVHIAAGGAPLIGWTVLALCTVAVLVAADVCYRHFELPAKRALLATVASGNPSRA